MRKPKLILIDGPIGAGKSTITELVDSKLKDTAVVDLDDVKWLVSDNKRDVKKYLNLASSVGMAMTKVYLSNGFNVIVVKAFTRERFIRPFIKLAKNKAKLYVYQIAFGPLK